MKRLFPLLLIACSIDGGSTISSDTDLYIRYELSLSDNISDVAFGVIYGSNGDVIEFSIDRLSSNTEINPFHKKLSALNISTDESIEIDAYQITKIEKFDNWQNCVFFLIYNDFKNNIVKTSLPQICQIDHIMNLFSDQNSKNPTIYAEIEEGEIIHLKNAVEFPKPIGIFSASDISKKRLGKSVSGFKSHLVRKVRKPDPNDHIQLLLNTLSHISIPKYGSTLATSASYLKDYTYIKYPSEIGSEMLKMAERAIENLDSTEENENSANLNTLDYLNYQKELKSNGYHPTFYASKIDESISFNLEDSGDSDAFDIYDNLMKAKRQIPNRKGRYQELDIASGIIETRQKYRQHLSQKLLNILSTLSNAIIRRNHLVIYESLLLFYDGDLEFRFGNKDNYN